MCEGGVGGSKDDLFAHERGQLTSKPRARDGSDQIGETGASLSRAAQRRRREEKNESEGKNPVRERVRGLWVKGRERRPWRGHGQGGER